MHKKGFNRLRLQSGRDVEGPVVVVFDDRNEMVSWHLLEGEEAMVEWVGGEFAVCV